MPYGYPYYNNPYSPYSAPYSTPQTANNSLPQNNLQTPQGANSGMIWVQGEAGAKSYLVAAGNSVLLMDSEQSRFYIKASDSSGMPLPLRIFEYSEITAVNPSKADYSSAADNNYVTHEELEARLKEIEIKPAKKEAKADVKSSV